MNAHSVLQIFWDFEMWMFPPLLFLHPSIARRCLHYRVERVEEARKWASANGYNGTMFPWESAFSGMSLSRVPFDIRG